MSVFVTKNLNLCTVLEDSKVVLHVYEPGFSTERLFPGTYEYTSKHFIGPRRILTLDDFIPTELHLFTSSSDQFDLTDLNLRSKSYTPYTLESV